VMNLEHKLRILFAQVLGMLFADKNEVVFSA